MAFSLQVLPLLPAERARLARMLETWPDQPVILLGEGFFQVSGGWSPPEVGGYMRLLYRALGEAMVLARVLPRDQAVLPPEGARPGAHLEPRDRAWLASLADRLLPQVALITPHGVLYGKAANAGSLGLVGVIGRGYEAIDLGAQARIRPRSPRSTRV